MPNPTLLTLSFVVYPTTDTDVADTLAHQLEAAIKTMPAEWQSTRFLTLDPSTNNCGQCTECQSWVTDRELPDAIAGLCNGACVNGRLLCDEHLPNDHRWAF